jgi:hypothetical protein
MQHKGFLGLVQISDEPDEALTDDGFNEHQVEQPGWQIAKRDLFGSRPI